MSGKSFFGQLLNTLSLDQIVDLSFELTLYLAVEVFSIQFSRASKITRSSIGLVLITITLWSDRA